MTAGMPPAGAGPDGAERLDRFMARANAAYYGGHDPFTDFTTAPEISQMFGEVLAVWTAMAWIAAGRPDPFLLIEAGPGRGTLMRDLRRGLRAAMPVCAAAARVQFIETSVWLRESQAALVPDAVWHDSLDSVPAGPMVLLANEFLDALPIRQFVRRPGGWFERYVSDGGWIEHPLPADEAQAVIPPRSGMQRDGAVVEINEPARAFVSAVAERIVGQPGAALFVDYGPLQSAAGDSLQAIAAQRMADPLADPGHADLTAHVDFSDLAAVARGHGAGVCGPLSQGAFLTAWGIFARARRLSAARPDQAEAIHRALLRLTGPDEMGELFKVLAITPLGWPDLLEPDSLESRSLEVQ
jgi:SAM-dependent MidA family methyltransferase